MLLNTLKAYVDPVDLEIKASNWRESHNTKRLHETACDCEYNCPDVGIETLREQSETTGMPLKFYLYSTANVLLYLTFYFIETFLVLEIDNVIDIEDDVQSFQVERPHNREISLFRITYRKQSREIFSGTFQQQLLSMLLYQ